MEFPKGGTEPPLFVFREVDTSEEPDEPLLGGELVRLPPLQEAGSCMVMVLPLARTVQAYMRQYGEDPPQLVFWRAHCGRRMHHHGRYWRVAVGRRQLWRIPVYRWLCPQCGTTLSVLPDFLKPFGRFVSLLREKAVWRRLEGWPFARIAAAVSSPAVSVVSERTLRRWTAATGQWAGKRGEEPSRRLLEVAPAVDPFGLTPYRTDPGAGLQCLRDVGRELQRQTVRLAPPPGPVHPGLFAFLNRFLGGPPYL